MGKGIEVLSFEDYYKKFLDLENPNINKIHLIRFEKLNELVKDAYNNPEAYERLYNLYTYYKNKLGEMGCGKKDYEAYYGL